MKKLRHCGIVIVVAAAGMSFGPAHSASHKVATLAPFTPWNVDYGNKICTLQRGFGTKEKPSFIIMERFAPTDWFQLTIIGDDFKSFQQGRTLSLRFGEQKPRHIEDVIPGSTAKKMASLFFPSVSLSEVTDEDGGWDPPVTAATEAAVKSITISYSGTDRVFTTGPLANAFQALRKCTDDLVRTWGLDPKQQATLSERPKPLSRPGIWLSSSDYPSTMLTKGKQAQVNFRLSIDPQGHPAACEIQSSHNDKKFDDVTCAILLRRARFSPALDAKGSAVPSYFVSTVRWIMRT